VQPALEGIDRSAQFGRESVARIRAQAWLVGREDFGGAGALDDAAEQFFGKEDCLGVLAQRVARNAVGRIAGRVDAYAFSARAEAEAALTLVFVGLR
jgi:hypothetical protein